MLSYPTEAQKGVFISTFWAILSLGAVVGSSVSLGQNIHSTVRSFIHSRLPELRCSSGNGLQKNSGEILIFECCWLLILRIP